MTESAHSTAADEKPATAWAHRLLVLSIIAVVVASFCGAISYGGRGTSIMVVAPLFLGAVAGATWGACLGCVMLVASLFGRGWRSRLFVPTAFVCISGALLAYQIYGPK